MILQLYHYQTNSNSTAGPISGGRSSEKYKFCVATVISLLYLTINQFVQAQEWQLLGLETETISAIVVDPFNENTIYVGSSSDFSAGIVLLDKRIPVIP